MLKPTHAPSPPTCRARTKRPRRPGSWPPGPSGEYTPCEGDQGTRLRWRWRGQWPWHPPHRWERHRPRPGRRSWWQERQARGTGRIGPARYGGCRPDPTTAGPPRPGGERRLGDGYRGRPSGSVDGGRIRRPAHHRLCLLAARVGLPRSWRRCPRTAGGDCCGAAVRRAACGPAVARDEGSGGRGACSAGGRGCRIARLPRCGHGRGPRGPRRRPGRLGVVAVCGPTGGGVQGDAVVDAVRPRQRAERDLASRPVRRPDRADRPLRPSLPAPASGSRRRGRMPTVRARSWQRTRRVAPGPASGTRARSWQRTRRVAPGPASGTRAGRALRWPVTSLRSCRG